jgi:hypothetical protein
MQTDLLTNYLLGAQSYLAQEASDPKPAPLAHGVLLPPRAPLYPDAQIIRHMRCYTLPSSTGDAEAGRQKVDGAAAAMQEVLAEGWQYHQTDPDNGAHKPGWMARRPGATWQVQVNADFTAYLVSSNSSAILSSKMAGDGSDGDAGDGDAGDGGAGDDDTGDVSKADDSEDMQLGQTRVIITYLLSHQHMGRVMVSCVSGCTCDPSVIDAHDAVNKHSINQLHEVRVSASPACVLQLKVLEQSSSGQHKFKVMQVAAAVNVDSSQQLAAIRRTAMEAAKRSHRHGK